MSSSSEVILITGSSGFIGSSVIRQLAQRFQIVGFDRPGPPHPPYPADCIDVDLTSDEQVQAALERVRRDHGGRITSVLHLAAYYSFSGKPSPLYEELTVKGTSRLLRALQGFDVEQFIFASTMLVHAPCEPGQKISEDWPLEAKWEYPKSKQKAEKLIRSERGNIPVVLLRISGVYDDLCHSIPIAHQIKRIYERSLTSRFFPGDLERGQAFVHVDDVSGAIDRLMHRRSKLPPELPLLLGEPETFSYGWLQSEIGSQLHGHPWKTYRIPKLLAKAGAAGLGVLPLAEDPFIKPWMIDFADDHYALDITRAKNLLGWQPGHRLGHSLPEMIRSLKANPEKWYRENHLGSPPSWKRAPHPSTTSR